MGIIKRLVAAYSVGFGKDRWDDLFSAGMMGAAVALDTFDQSKGDIKQHISRGVRNHILMELRKIKRWDKEHPYSRFEEGWQNDKNSFKAGSAGHRGSHGDDDDTTFSESISANTGGFGNAPMWVEPTLNPEEECLQKEVVEQVNDRIADIIPQLNEREQYVFWNNIHTDSPVSIREIAGQFRVGKSSIHRDRKRILKLLKEDI